MTVSFRILEQVPWGARPPSRRPSAFRYMSTPAIWASTVTSSTKLKLPVSYVMQHCESQASSGMAEAAASAAAAVCVHPSRHQQPTDLCTGQAHLQADRKGHGQGVQPDHPQLCWPGMLWLRVVWSRYGQSRSPACAILASHSCYV